MWGRVYSLGHMINLSKILRAKTKTCHSRSVKHHQGKKKAKIFPLQPLKPWVGDHNSLKQYACTISLIFWTIHIYLRVLSTWTNQTLKHIRLEITSMFEICSKTCMHVYIWREKRISDHGWRIRLWKGVHFQAVAYLPTWYSVSPYSIYSKVAETKIQATHRSVAIEPNWTNNRNYGSYIFFSFLPTSVSFLSVKYFLWTYSYVQIHVLQLGVMRSSNTMII